MEKLKSEYKDRLRRASVLMFLCAILGGGVIYFDGRILRAISGGVAFIGFVHFAYLFSWSLKVAGRFYDKEVNLKDIKMLKRQLLFQRLASQVLSLVLMSGFIYTALQFEEWGVDRCLILVSIWFSGASNHIALNYSLYPQIFQPWLNQGR